MTWLEKPNTHYTQAVRSLLDSGQDFSQPELLKELQRQYPDFSESDLSRSITQLMQGKMYGINSRARYARLIP